MRLPVSENCAVEVDPKLRACRWHFATDVIAEEVVEELSRELTANLKAHRIERMVVDAKGVKILATSVLGLLAQVASSGIAVTINCPTDQLLELLATTHLDRLFTVAHTAR